MITQFKKWINNFTKNKGIDNEYQQFFDIVVKRLTRIMRCVIYTDYNKLIEIINVDRDQINNIIYDDENHVTKTALIFTVDINNLKIKCKFIELLINNGADVFMLDSNGSCFFDIIDNNTMSYMKKHYPNLVKKWEIEKTINKYNL